MKPECIECGSMFVDFLGICPMGSHLHDCMNCGVSFAVAAQNITLQ
tara:strand:+ start:284 stop:421 length:138 start_codon:yes stop_codon:yes gene_type:complete